MDQQRAIHNLAHNEELPIWLYDSVALSEKLLSRVPERFRSKVQVNLQSGCWEWTMGLGRGYARYSQNNKPTRGHRYSYQQLVGEIPDGLQLDHLCRIRRCVNPFHLEAVTGRENKMRGTSPAARAAVATHCINGHPFDEVNTYWRPDGKRTCKICRKRWKAEHERRKLSA